MSVSYIIGTTRQHDSKNICNYFDPNNGNISIPITPNVIKLFYVYVFGFFHYYFFSPSNTYLVGKDLFTIVRYLLEFNVWHVRKYLHTIQIVLVSLVKYQYLLIVLGKINWKNASIAHFPPRSIDRTMLLLKRLVYIASLILVVSSAERKPRSFYRDSVEGNHRDKSFRRDSVEGLPLHSKLEYTRAVDDEEEVFGTKWIPLRSAIEKPLLPKER